MRWLISLAFFISGCMPVYGPTTTPHIGWTAAEVERAIGRSYTTASTASGFESWTYGISAHTRWVSGRCYPSDRCMTLHFLDNRVVDILYY